MNSSARNTVIFLLALGSLAGGAIAWRQHLELAALRDASRSSVDRSDLRRQLAASQQRVRALEDALAAGRPAPEPVADETPAPPRGREEFERGGRGGRGGPGGRGDSAMRALMDSPQAQQLMQQQQRLALDGRYAALFKNLNLAPEKLEQLKSLLLEKQTVMQDVMAAARGQGVDPRDNPQEFRKMITAAQAELDGGLKTLLGDEAFAQYDQYQKTLPQRNVVTQLEQSLSYTNAPLSPTQADQLVHILASTAPQTPAPAVGEAPGRGGFGGPMGGRGPGGSVGGGGATAPITTEAVKLAGKVLSAPQLAALQQLQQTQEAQKQLSDLMRSGRGESRGGRE